MVIFLRAIQLLLSASVLWVAIHLRAPLLASLRTELGWGVVIALVLSLGLSAIARKNNQMIAKILNILGLSVLCAGLIILLVFEGRFHAAKRHVLTASIADVSLLGKHFIVGYRDFDEVKMLVDKQAVGGIFLTTRNIKGKTKEEIQQEIQTLQKIRTRQGLLPLWIATDQEGGMVSRLSPPLAQLPSLSEAIASLPDSESRKPAVREYASLQGKELAELGVNLNFAPVVDLNKNIVNPNDKYSQIYKRAISSDREIVAQVALEYCQTLEKYRVRCTLKHFPGLGRADKDTHLESVRLQTPVAELSRDDWVPFRTAMQNSKAATMLGHAILTEVDRDRPVSFSKAAIAGILRQDWQYDGLLITDDFCMYAVYRSREGLEKATIAALNAGVDLILIAYDSDLYYPAMSALLKAKHKGALDRDILQQSQARLAREKPNPASSENLSPNSP